jgi:hypothetical protein
MQFHGRFIIALTAVALSWAAKAEASDRALVIGVNQYQNVTPQLHGSVPDAMHFADLLKDEFGFEPQNIKVLTDSDATRSNILSQFRHWIIEGTKPGDRAVFYFSGHGAQVMVPDGAGGKRITSAIVPVDTDRQGNGFILGPEIGSLIKKLHGRKLTVIADSCFSGSITRDPDARANYENAPIKTITPVLPIDLAPSEITDEIIAENKTETRFLDLASKGDVQGGDVAVWSAASLAQVAFDGPDGGVFTSNFIAGLRDGTAENSASARVTASALLSHVREKSEEYCRNAGQNCKDGLTPQLQASDLYLASVLVPYSASPPPSPPPTGPDLVDLAQGVLAHHNDFALSAEILPSPKIKHGAAVQFRIKSAEEGQLLVFDTGPDRKFRRIYPNPYAMAAGRKGLVRAGAALTIPDQSYPFEFTATDDGQGTLIVLVAEKGLDLGPLLQGPAFEPVNNADRNLVAVAAQLQQPVLDPNPQVPNRAHRWAFVTVPYVVEP